jgi:hypothetical protein
MHHLQNHPAYIAFCDEAGDPGLTATASDWFIASAVVVRVENAGLAAKWIADIKSPMKNQKRADLHFNRLRRTGMKERACSMLAGLPVRGFTVVSCKSNMRNYRNPAVEYVRAKKEFRDDGSLLSMELRNHWFHNWMLKVLVERISDFCAKQSIKDCGACRPVQFVIASRDGFYLHDFVEYLKLDQENERNGTSTLRYHPDWRVIDWELFGEAPAANVPGLQLADIVCGAFLHSVDKRRFGACNPELAKTLRPVMARNQKGELHNYSVTRWPWHWWKAKIPPDQTDIFRFYGYPK